MLLDLARTTERHEYYFALPPRLAEWGYNALFLHFNDDRTCALRFGRHPELAGPHAFTIPEMKRLVADCEARGIMVVPEIESFGHTGYIHGLARYAHLRDSAVEGGHFSGINPLHRETRAIMRDLVAEVAEIFPAPYIHAGLDEVRFGNHPQVKRALRTTESWEIFAEYVEFMRVTVARAGKTMMMWGDHLLREPRLADRVSREIIICNWQYMAEVHAGKYAPLLRRGFRVVACPTSNSAGDMIAPNADKLINLQRSAGLARQPGCVGYLNTVWCPMRMLCGVEQAALALGGAWADDPQADPRAVLARFARTQFGLARPSAPGRAILEIMIDLPKYSVLAARMNGGRVDEPAASAIEVERAHAQAVRAARLRAVLVQARAGVRQNRREYDTWILACDVWRWTARVCLGRAMVNPAPPLSRLLAEGRELLARVVANWNAGRYADDPMRDLPGQWPDALIPNLRCALKRLQAEAARRRGTARRARGCV